ncbi:MAG: CapA family protein [Patescibacteria group bacterium]
MPDLIHLFVSLVASFVALFPATAVPNAFPSLPRVAPPHFTVLFAGDMMFDRTIRTAVSEKGGDFIFSCIDPVLKEADLVVANLEGPITDKPSKSMGTPPGSDGNYTFTFPTSTAALLAAHNIRLVNIGNNHIKNFGTSGVRSTISALDDARVKYFGDPLDHTVAAEDFGDIHLAFINYNEFGGNTTTTIRQIEDARMAGTLPIVYTHWGVEYATTSPEYIRTLARRFIDAGAEIVVGSHPHVVEEREFYREKYIYYSLGNFIFDQYWNGDVRRGLVLNVAFDKAGVQYVEEIPVELGRDRRTCPLVE